MLAGVPQDPTPVLAPEARPRAGLGARVGLAATALLVGLFAAELLVRALGWGPTRFAETRHLESADKRVGLDLYPSDPDDSFAIDLREPAARAAWAQLPGLDAWADAAPHAVEGHYSRELCRVSRAGATLPTRAPGRGRVVLVGDSFLEGQGVAFEHTVAAQLAAALPEHDVLACGRRGYDFTLVPSDPRGLSHWMRDHVLDADVVLYAMTLNDPARSAEFQARQSYVDDWIVERRRMLGHDAVDGPGPQRASDPWSPRLGALINERLEALRIGGATMRWYTEMLEAPNEAGWAATLDQLEAFARELWRDGRRLLVALWPLLVGLEDASGYPFTQTHARIVRALEARGLRVVDTLTAFVGADTERLWVHEVDHHPNADAHGRFTGAILPALRDALALRSRPPEAP